MGTRYYELIISGRQLLLLAAGIVALVTVAFLLGVGVGLQEPAPVMPTPPAYVASVAQAAKPTARAQAEPTQAPLESAAPPLGPAPSPTAAPPMVAALPALPRNESAAPMPAATTAPRSNEVSPAAEVTHWVQVAALSREDLALGVRQRIVALGFRPEQVVVRPTGGSYRVRLGPFPDEASTRRVVSRLRAQGFADAFPVTE